MARRSKKNTEETISVSKEKVFDVGAYVRLSAVDRKQKGDSIETQQSIIKAYISERRDLELREIYIDNGLSGQSFERPAFQQMLADIERGKIECCVMKDLSRLGRNAMETGYYMEKFFPVKQIRLISINDNYDSQDPRTGGIIVSLKNTINEVYALEVGRKIRQTKQMHIRKGYFVGRFPPFGYLKNPNDKYRLIPDSYAVPIVKEIFEMAANGQTVREILDWINEEGILPPKRYFHSIGLATEKEAGGHIHWNRGVIYTLLHNRVYCGDMVQGKYHTKSYVQKKVPEESWVITENTHEALVSRELFANAQALWCKSGRMASRCVLESAHASSADGSTDQPVTPPSPLYKTPSSQNIFLRKIFCGHCGHAMRRDRINENNYYFRCATRSFYQKDDCVVVTIKEKELRARLVQDIRKQASVFSKGAKNAAQLEKADESDSALLKSIQKEKSEKDDELMNLYLDRLSGIITEDHYMDVKRSLNERVKELSNKEETLKNDIRERRILNASRIIATECFNMVKNRNDLNSEVIDKLVERINIYDDKRIEIIFKFLDEAAACTIKSHTKLIKDTIERDRVDTSPSARSSGRGGADNA